MATRLIINFEDWNGVKIQLVFSLPPTLLQDKFFYIKILSRNFRPDYKAAMLFIYCYREEKSQRFTIDLVTFNVSVF